MASINKVLLLGNIGKDPEVRHLDGGNSVASFSLATSESYKNKAGEKVENTTWHNVVIWGKLAEVVEKYVKKGDSLFVEGKLTTRSYDDKDGNKKYITDIVGSQIQLMGTKSESKETPEMADTGNSTDLPF